jgi:hypothetical protein
MNSGKLRGMLKNQVFLTETCRVIEERIGQFNPKQFQLIFSMFEDEKAQSKIVKSAVKALKQQKVEVRDFNIN